MNEQNNPILEVKNLRVSYHTYAGEVKAVRGVQFSLEKGQALAIVGESGCGKSASSRPRRVRLKRTVKFSIMERIF